MLSVLIGLMFASPVMADDTREAVNEAGVKILDDFAAVLRTVKDRESAGKSVEKIGVLSDEMKSLRIRGEAFPKLKPEDKRRYEAAYSERMAAANEALHAEFLRIAKDVDGGKDYCKKIERLMKDALREVINREKK